MFLVETIFCVEVEDHGERLVTGVENLDRALRLHYYGGVSALNLTGT